MLHISESPVHSTPTGLFIVGRFLRPSRSTDVKAYEGGHRQLRNDRSRSFASVRSVFPNWVNYEKAYVPLARATGLQKLLPCWFVRCGVRLLCNATRANVTAGTFPQEEKLTTSNVN